jgi:hypothetical protein
MDDGREAICFPFVRITQEFDLNWLVSHGVFTEECNRSIQTIPGWFVFME